MTQVPAPSPEGDTTRDHGAQADRLARAHGWVLDHWPTTVRRRIAVVVVVVAVGLVAVSWLDRLVGAAIDLGLLAYVGLMVVCWVGAGGALVPVPGVRPLSWVMVVHQGAVLSPPLVVMATAIAMALGQSSYFIAVRTETRRQAAGSGHRWHGRGGGARGDAAPVSSDGEARHEKTSAVNGLVARSRELLARGRSVVERRMTDHPRRIIFLLCVVPNPLTTFATVTAASTGVSFSRFFAASLGGFLVLAIALVVAGQGILAALGIT